MEMNHEYASKGVAGAGLGTGIAGLSLGVLNAVPAIMSAVSGAAAKNSGNVSIDVLTAMLAASMMPSVNSRSGGPCNGDCEPVTQRELNFIQQLAEKDKVIAAQETQNALLKANTFTDEKSIELYKYVDGRFREFEAQLASQAVKNQAVSDSIQMVQERLECATRELEGKIKVETRERCCADDAIVNYVNSTFYTQAVADVNASTTTSTPKSTYNPLPACSCNCGR